MAPTIGEAVVVTGLGLIGQITVQLLKANGCRVLGIDVDPSKCDLARKFGAETVDLSKDEDPLEKAKIFSRGIGIDAVIITASTKSNDPVSDGAKMCRQRGRIVLVGVSGLKLSRDDFYKEISFQVSCSYGPGRYDTSYEDKGHDYPVGLVRWTEQRNFEAVLDLMSSRGLNMHPLITHRFEIEDAIDAYQSLDDPTSLGIVLNYPANAKDLLANRSLSIRNPDSYDTGDVICGFVGGGNYASRILIPAFKASLKAKLDTIVTSGGLSAILNGNKNNFATASTDLDQVLKNESINAVVIATQHNLHVTQVVQALNCGRRMYLLKNH